MNEKNITAEEAKEKTTEQDSNVYMLKKPFEYEDRKYTGFTFEFDKLNGFDMIDTESELRDRGKFFITPETDTSFIIAIAAKATNVSDTVLSALPIADFLAIKRMTQRFLNSRD